MSPDAGAIAPRYVRSVGGDRRPGHPRRAARALSRRAHRPRLRVDGSGRRLRGRRRARRISGGDCRAPRATCGSACDDGSLRIRSAAHGARLPRRRGRAAGRRRRLRRHGRHRRAARRPLLLPRPAKRRHQRRRTEGPSRGSRGGHQPAPARPHVDGPRRSRARSPARSSPRMSCSSERGRRRRLDARDSDDVPRHARRRTRFRRPSASFAALESGRDRQAGPPCRNVDRHRRKPRPRPRRSSGA